MHFINDQLTILSALHCYKLSITWLTKSRPKIGFNLRMRHMTRTKWHTENSIVYYLIKRVRYIITMCHKVGMIELNVNVVANESNFDEHTFSHEPHESVWDAIRLTISSKMLRFEFWSKHFTFALSNTFLYCMKYRLNRTYCALKN